MIADGYFFVPQSYYRLLSHRVQMALGSRGALQMIVFIRKLSERVLFIQPAAKKKKQRCFMSFEIADLNLFPVFICTISFPHHALY